MKKRLINYFKRQLMIKKQREKAFSDKYDSMHGVWLKKVEKTENSVRKKQKDAKYRECYEKTFPELRKRREEKERLAQKQKAASEVLFNPSNNSNNSNLSSSTGHTNQTQQANNNNNNNTASIFESLQSELTSAEEERKRLYDLAIVPPMCLMLDPKHKHQWPKYIDNNGFVADPIALFKSVKSEVYWNEKEKETFLEKMLTYGKNFEAIATFLDKKRVQDCIEYYYLTKKKINYKLLIRKQQRKRKKDVKSNHNANNSVSNSNILTV
jgi:hypothetical protein